MDSFIILCPYLLQISHRVQVDMLKQVFPREDSAKTQKRKYYRTLRKREHTGQQQNDNSLLSRAQFVAKTLVTKR